MGLSNCIAQYQSAYDRYVEKQRKILSYKPTQNCACVLRAEE